MDRFHHWSCFFIPRGSNAVFEKSSELGVKRNYFKFLSVLPEPLLYFIVLPSKEVMIPGFSTSLAFVKNRFKIHI